MYVEEQELREIPWDYYFLRGVDQAMGELAIPGDYGELEYDRETDKDVEFTEEQDEAMDSYEIAYYKLMEAGKEVIEVFGFRSTYG